MCGRVIMSSFVSLCLLRDSHPWATSADNHVCFPPGALPLLL